MSASGEASFILWFSLGPLLVLVSRIDLLP
jgi:hypothetical protein